ncbi:MAG: hypothetical protein ABL912_14350 [Novosphingobium sp.]
MKEVASLNRVVRREEWTRPDGARCTAWGVRQDIGATAGIGLVVFPSGYSAQFTGGARRIDDVIRMMNLVEEAECHAR